MRRAVVLLLVLLVAPLAAGERQCASEGSATVCSDGFSETEASEPTVLGEARVETYTDRREGGGDVDYQVIRSGARASLGSEQVDVQRVQYEGASEGTQRPGETRTVRFDEVRAEGAGRHAAVGLRRTTFDDGSTSVEVCDVYVFDESARVPCSPLFP